MTERKTGAGGKLLLLSLGGFFGGMANGLLGAGGGIIMTFVLEAAMSGEDMARRDIFANVIAATLPISLFSTMMYALRGNIDSEKFGIYAIPAVAGGLLGAVLLSRIDTRVLKVIFGVIVIWSGIYMMLK